MYPGVICVSSTAAGVVGVVGTINKSGLRSVDTGYYQPTTGDQTWFCTKMKYYE